MQDTRSWRDVGQQLRALATLLENPGPIPSPHTPVPGDLLSFSGLSGHQARVHWLKCRQSTHTHKTIVKVKAMQCINCLITFLFYYDLLESVQDVGGYVQMIYHVI